MKGCNWIQIYKQRT